MRLGIDFGTTRVVVAAVDRGNYPVAVFECADGASRDWFPSLMAVRGTERRYGWDAWMAQQEPGWTVVRSLKRILAQAGLETRVQVAEQTLPLRTILEELTRTLKRDLAQRSNLNLSSSEPLEIMLGVPANANSNQRFLTAEGFRLGGFQVLGMLNEPSAASIEFGHRQRISESSRKTGCVLIYDLGGGTFDASLVEMDERTHTVLASEGIYSLGGDDFDEMLAELALDAAGTLPAARDSLTQAQHFRLHEECRLQKEGLHPNSRRIILDLAAARDEWGEITVPVSDYYERCRPLIAETLDTVADLLAAHGLAPDAAAGDSEATRRLEAVYVTGGGSELPLVARELRERYGRKVRRSAHAHQATAIGLAIQADAQAGYVLKDRFTRFFGVWREAAGGTSAVFDPLFPKGAALPGPWEPPLASDRSYSPVHNIGHFRYLECSRLGDGGWPTGDITVWDEIRFPFDPVLEACPDLAAVEVGHNQNAMGQTINESYSCSAGGSVAVTISNLTSGYSKRYQLARWAPAAEPVTPGRSVRSGKRSPAKSRS